MWVRRLAVAAAFLTLVLIVAGGLVTNTDSGLACPDWPTCFGSPMPKMAGGVAVEHTHRLIATLVGLCTLGLCIGTLPRRLWLLLCGVFAPLLLAGAFVAARLQQRDGAVRRAGAGLVCVEMPYCRGALWPTGVHPAVHLHMLHRAVAFAVLALVCWNAVQLARGTRGLVRVLAWAGPALAVLQIALGV